MKKYLTLLLLVVISSCQIDWPVHSGDVVKTGDAEVSENSVTFYGYLNVDAFVRSTCRFGILYSMGSEPSKDNGLLVTSTELDSHNKFAVTLNGLFPDTEYYYKAYVMYESGSYQYGKVKSFKTKKITGGSIVDLGLSVKWATCNLGATKPEQYGGYYQWAGLQDVTSTSITLDLSNCPYHTGSSSSTGWAKYVPSNKTVLDPEDDVAHVKLGGKWRMPTDAEWTELIDNCTWAWTTLNGVNGYRVTSNKTGNSIFLPAAGCRDGTILGDAGSYGNYWSSTLDAGGPGGARGVYFGSDDVGRGNYCRYEGLSVRPVYGDAAVAVTYVRLDITNLILTEGCTQTLTATITPSNATNKNVTWSSSNTLIATVSSNGVVTAKSAGTATITVKTSDGSKTATCQVTVTSSGSEYSEYVDLGLSVKWASCNLDANLPEQYGGYYQWAGLQDVTSTSINLVWSNCPYHTGVVATTGWTKYVPSSESSYWSGSGSPDNKTVLDPEDDVAHVKLGGKWRIPTDAEWTELRKNCTWTSATLNGVKGYWVTSKKTGNSIFLPAAGYRGGTALGNAGSYGSYWSSSLSTVYPNGAYYVFFDSDYVYRIYYDRFNGLSVRPVSE